MAISAVTSRGTNQVKASGTTITISPSAAIAVGKIAFVRVAADNIGTTNAFSSEHSIADTDGHTWTKATEYRKANGAAADGLTESIFLTKVTAEIGTSDVVTVTFSSAITAKTVQIGEFTVGAGNTFTVAATANDVDLATADTVTISGLASAETLFIGMSGRENASAAPTEDADYTALNDSGTSGGSAATNIQLHTGFRIVTATGDTYSPTNLGTGDRLMILVAVREVSEGQNINVGQAVETDVAQPIGKTKSKAIGQAVSSEIAQPIGVLKSRTIGQAVSIEQAQAIAKAKTKTLGQAVSTEIAQPITKGAVSIPIGQAVSTEIAQPIGEAKAKTIGQAVETDIAQPIGRAKSKVLGQAISTEIAQAIKRLLEFLTGLGTSDGAGPSGESVRAPGSGISDGAGAGGTSTRTENTGTTV